MFAALVTGVALLQFAIAQPQPASVNATLIADGAGNQVRVQWNANDGGSSQVTAYEVTVDPVPLFSRVPWNFYAGDNSENVFSPRWDTRGTVLDTTRWTARTSIAGQNCPLNTQPSWECTNNPSSITVRNRAATFMAWRGQFFALQQFMSQLTGSSIGTWPMQNGAPLLEAPGFAFAQASRTSLTLIEAVITTMNDGRNPVGCVGAACTGWNTGRAGTFGLMLYDYDLQGRVRPITRVVFNEQSNAFGMQWPQCAAGAFISCFWSGNLWTTSPDFLFPNATNPWRLAFEFDPNTLVINAIITGRGITNFRPPVFAPNVPFSLNPNIMNISTQHGAYWTRYLNNATFGLFNISNVRAGIFSENSAAGFSGYTAHHQVTFQRMIVYDSVIPPAARPLFGTTDAWSIAQVGSPNTLNSVRLNLTNAGSLCPLTPLNPPTLGVANPVAACRSTPSTVSVVNGQALMTTVVGHHFNVQAFMADPAGNNDIQNGVPVLGLNMENPAAVSGVFTFEVSSTPAYSIIAPAAMTRPAVNGILLYDVDNRGRIRPVMKLGFQESIMGPLSSWQAAGSCTLIGVWVPSCSSLTPATCTWQQRTGTSWCWGTFNAGLWATPQRIHTYSVARDPVARTWNLRLNLPGQQSSISLQAASLLSGRDTDVGVGTMNQYWTGYLNNAAYGLFDWANVKVGFFTEMWPGQPNGVENNPSALMNFMNLTVARAYVTSLAAEFMGPQADTYNLHRTLGTAYGNQCGFGQPIATNVSRTVACGSATGTACTATVTLPTPATDYTVTVTATTGAGARSSPVAAPGVYKFNPTLPVPGAQLWLDANSLPTWLGSDDPNINYRCPATGGLTGSAQGWCRPLVWWPDSTNNSYLFGVPQDQEAARPVLRPWSPRNQYQAVEFNGNGGRMILDRTIMERDADFHMRFPGQIGPNFDPAFDAENTWFLLYQATDPMVTSGQQVVFSKGIPTSASVSQSYGWYSQMTSANGAGFDQNLGGYVSGDLARQVGTTMGRKYGVASTAIPDHPHEDRPTLITMMHYRNNTNMVSTRSFRLDACEGLTSGSFVGDRCSNSGPADRWSPGGPADRMGVQNIIRQANLPAGTPLGNNVVDYALSVYSGTAPMPLSNGVFGLGAAHFNPPNPGGSLYFRGSIMALVMYRRRLSDSERQSVQTYLLQRYNQYCPPIPAPAGASNGCPAGGPGDTCSMSCSASASFTRERIGGAGTLVCADGGWRGKGIVCGAVCPSRSSPTGWASCRKRYATYDFSDAAAFPTNLVSAYSASTAFEAYPSAFLGGGGYVTSPWGVLDRSWQIIGSPTPRQLVGTVQASTSQCTPDGSGPLFLLENGPAYLERVAPGGLMIVDATFTLRSRDAQAGIAVRATATGGAYLVLFGSGSATGSPVAMSVQKVSGQGVVSPLPNLQVVNPLPLPLVFDGSQRYSIRVTVRSVSGSDFSQMITVELVEFNTILLMNVTDTASPVAFGGAGFVVRSGSAGFDRMSMQGDCDQSGNSCAMTEGQACTWTCEPGTLPFLGTTRYLSTAPVWETCDATGQLPGPTTRYSCQPPPPTFPGRALNVSEIASAGFVLGSMTATPASARDIVLYNLSATNNQQRLFDRFGVDTGTIATGVFGINACSGEVVLVRGGVLTWDLGTRVFNLQVTACTNGSPLACTTAALTITVQPSPRPPFFRLDSDPNNPDSASGSWLRTIAENANGALVLDAAGTAAGAPIEAYSPNNAPLEYSITSGNDIDRSRGLVWFTINATTGHIRSASPSLINFELQRFYTLTVQARDRRFPANNTEFSALTQVTIRVLDRNDPPVNAYRPLAPPPFTAGTQLFAVPEDRMAVRGPLFTLAVTDEDADEAFTVSFVGSAPEVGGQPLFNMSVIGTSINIALQTPKVYPDVQTLPIQVWNGSNVREAVSFTVRVTDRAGVNLTVPVQVGVSAAAGATGEPRAQSVTFPNPTVGLETRGGQTITVTGLDFSRITTSFGGLVVITLIAPLNDPVPNRTYPCANARVATPTTITCIAPHAWGVGLQVRIVYGSSPSFFMASDSALVVSYAPPQVSAGMHLSTGAVQSALDSTYGLAASLPTRGSLMLVLTATNLGTQADAPRTLRVEYGLPLPNDPLGRLEYTAPYVPCVNATVQEVWATPANPAGAGGGASRVCIMVPAGIGANHRFQVRVGTALSALSSNTAIPAGSTFSLSYRPPFIDRVWRPINANGDAPPAWDTSNRINQQDFRPGDEVWFNGTDFGPVDKLPWAMFYMPTNTRIMFDNGRSLLGSFNHTPMLNSFTGLPDCRKPFPAQAHSVMACRLPFIPSTGIRIRLQSGNTAYTENNIWHKTLDMVRPVISAVSGPGSRMAGTEGGQEIYVTGVNFGPTASTLRLQAYNLWQPEIRNPNDGNWYQINPGNTMDNTVIPPVPLMPVTLWYGIPGSPVEYTATGCTIISETPATVRCLSAPGVGRSFQYRLSIAGINVTLGRQPTFGYSPPMITGVTRASAEQVADPQLGGAVPTVRDYRTAGGEILIINGRNFGPCPGSCNFLERSAGGDYFAAEYYVQMLNVGTAYNTSLTTTADRRLWYNLTACNMTTPHQTIQCRTAGGAGTDAIVRITVAGQTSVLPTTSYQAPSITGLRTGTASVTAPASTDGGDTLFITGSNFGPRRNTDGATGRTRGMIQSITYGVTGTEYQVADWDIPSTASSTHTEVHALLAPGVGTNLKVIVRVSDQSSEPSVSTFSYAAPTVTEMTPATGPTNPSDLMPTVVRLNGTNFGLMNAFAALSVQFGNPEDRTLVTGLPLVSFFPDVRSSSQVSQYLAQTVRPRTEFVTFRVPPGLGRRRAVRIAAVDRTSEIAVPVLSAPVFFDYADPVIETVIVEALQMYNGNNESAGLAPEWIAASARFTSEQMSTLRRLSIPGSNFGIFAQSDVAQYVDIAVASGGPAPTSTSAEWVPHTDANSPALLFSWTPSRVVLLTTLESAWVRIRIVAREFGSNDPLPQTSAPFYYMDVSPSIGNVVGSAGPFNTAGGDVLAFTVTNLVSTSASLAVTVTSSGVSRPCPLLYAPDDGVRGAGQEVPTGKVLDHIVFNRDSGYTGYKYFNTATLSTSSVWTLYCRLPVGEGSGASLQVVRDTIVSDFLPIRYSRPTIDRIEVQAGTQWQTIPYVYDALVSVPTVGQRMRIIGSSFGVCPGIALAGRVNVDAPGCSGSRTVQQGSMYTSGRTAGSNVVEFLVPEGQGSGFTLAVVAGDQSSLEGRAEFPAGQLIRFTYNAPVITAIQGTGRTAGGDVITIVGSDLGAEAPASISLGPSLECLNIQREEGGAGHTRVQCTVPEGSGKALTVVLTTGGTLGVPQRATLAAGFSYLPPMIEYVLVTDPVTLEVRAYNASTAASRVQATGPVSGGYMVTLVGDNFGASGYGSVPHCVFVAWRARDPSLAFTCDGRENHVGEGELPRLAFDEYAVDTQVSGPVIQWTHTSMSFLFPPGYGVKDLIVFVNGNVPALPPRWQYGAPVIASTGLTPSRGPTDGGTPLTLVGFNFGVPPVDTSTEAGRLSLVSRPLPTSRTQYLTTWQSAPMAALYITFGRGCVTSFLNDQGVVPSALSACDFGSISRHDPTDLAFVSSAGIGVNRTVTVSVWDREPNEDIPGQFKDVRINSNPVYFSYDPPVALLTSPRPILLDDRSEAEFSIQGVNFGAIELQERQGWTAEERALNVTVGTVRALSAERGIATATGSRKIDQIQVRIPNMPVGIHSLRYLVAGQVGFTPASNGSRAAVLIACESGVKSDFRTEEMGPFGGFFGRPGETCAPCPVGAVCLGWDPRFGPADPTLADRGQHMYPIPVIGFYNLNNSDTLSSGMYEACPPEIRAQYPNRDTCVVRCDPPEACLGANQCAPEYVSKAPMFRCASCAAGFYKRATVCVKCPDSPWALVIGFTLLVLTGGGVAYVLNSVRINIAYIAIAIDYFQVLAIFAQSRVQWPAALQELFHVLSAFNLNIEIVAPECIVPDLGFQRKWSFVMAFPLSIQVFFALVTLGNLGYKALVKGQKVKLAHIGGAIMASVLMVMYVMYIYLTRNILDIYNCRPTDPPDGKTYMSAVFEECGKPGGVQLTLLPAAVVATVVYIIGYPAAVGYLLFTNVELVMEDQLVRAKGQGDDRSTNPHAYEFRKRWGRLYYQFKPDACLWILAIILRKFLIAATFVLFNTQPAFQLAAVFLVLFLAYSAQMRFSPYMSPQDFPRILAEHDKLSLVSPLHARLRATLSSINSRTKKVGRRNVITATGQIDSAALLGILRGWLFNYNTVEQLLLFSAGVVCVMGMMFAAQQRKSSTYRESRDAITSVVIAVVSLSIIYLFTVFVTEVTVLAGETNRKTLAKAGQMAEETKVGSSRKLTGKSTPEAGSMPAAVFDAGDVSSATNPMFLGSSSAQASPAMSSLSVGGKDASGQGQAGVDALTAMAAITSMRQPPATKELWQIYREKFEELAATVETLKQQVENAPASLKATSRAAGAEPVEQKE